MSNSIIFVRTLIRRQVSRLRVFLNSYGAMARIIAPRPILHQLPVQASTYTGLSSTSLLFEFVAFNSSSSRFVNLMLPSLEESAMFAGSHTAIEFARLVAEESNINLRFLTTDPGARLSKTLIDNPAEALGLTTIKEPLRLSVDEFKEGQMLEASLTDIWIVTHWTTAHSVDIAVRCNKIQRHQVIYLVQDYEPGFSAWSTEHALSCSTYHAGFNMVINSKTLATYLRQTEGVDIPASHIFAPHLPLDQLLAVSTDRTYNGKLGVFFYARPKQLRNLFPIGIATLRRTVELLGDSALQCEWFSAGEPHPDLWLGEKIHLKSLGDVGYKGYWALLKEVHVGLALMYSPHPSHLPLELAISGARAVTNLFSSINKSVHPLLTTAPADPDQLAHKLVDAIRAALVNPKGPYEPIESDVFGGKIEDAASAVLRSINNQDHSVKNDSQAN